MVDIFLPLAQRLRSKSAFGAIVRFDAMPFLTLHFSAAFGLLLFGFGFRSLVVLRWIRGAFLSHDMRRTFDQFTDNYPSLQHHTGTSASISDNTGA